VLAFRLGASEDGLVTYTRPRRYSAAIAQLRRLRRVCLYPRWLLAMTRTSGAVSIATVALVLGLAVSGCSGGPPESASNAIIDAATTGLDSDDLPHSYARLCAAQQVKVPQDEFVRTGGEAVSPIFTRRGWSGQDDKEDPPDVKTLDTSVTQATRVYQVQKKTGPTGLDFVYEEWKISLVREDGKWKLCGFEMLESYPLVEDYETRCATTTIKGCP